MDVTPKLATGRALIQRYGGGGFVLREQEYPHGVLVLPDMVLPWPVRAAEAIAIENFAHLFTQYPQCELLIIGTGVSQAFIAPELRQALRTRGIAVDAMDTGAACRTYNVLLSEERRVAAALIAV